MSREEVMACNIDQSRYSDPMPWIGLYVTAATIGCSMAMVGDIIYGLLHRKLWFPCRFFSLNATSLTLLAIATKLPVDLNSPMLQHFDQLTKLSGTVLICTAMANFMPSLGTMEDSQLILNVFPLGILVITVIVNIGIEMHTGVIRIFLVDHIIIVSIMLIMLLFTSSSALTVSTTKQLLKQQYESKHQQAMDDTAATSTVEKLKIDMRKYWMMAHSNNPQYVVIRSTMCVASGALCLLGALVLTTAFRQSGYMETCSAESSDYGWTTVLISLTQLLAVWVGTVAPTCRWVRIIRHMNPFDFKVERYWIQRLVEWRGKPLPFHVRNRSCRKLIHGLKSLLLLALLLIQATTVLLSKSIRFLFRVITTLFLFPCFILSCLPCIALSSIIRCFRRASSLESGSSSGAALNLLDFVLHLEGEEGLVPFIMKQGNANTEKWIRRGRKNRPHLTDLLKKSTPLQGFKGVGEFDSNRIPPAGLEEPPNCWALPLVTLTSIAIAIPRTGDDPMIKSLLLGVCEGLRCVRLIEKKLDMKGLVSIREAADFVWLGVDLHRRWLDVDLPRMAREQKDAKKVIEKLASIGFDCVSEFEKGTVTEGRRNKVRALAGNSMYRICRTILEDYDNNFPTEDGLLEWLQVVISDILGACLTNLPRVVSMECYSSVMEAKEEGVRKAACLLGESESILEILGHQGIQDLGMDQCPYIDEWRLRKLKEKNNPSRLPLSAISNRDPSSSSTSGVFRISIE